MTDSVILRREYHKPFRANHAALAMNLQNYGFVVALPTSNEQFDAIILKNGKYSRIKVISLSYGIKDHDPSVYLDDSNIYVDLRMGNKQLFTDIDYFFVMSKNLYLIPISAVQNRKTITLGKEFNDYLLPKTSYGDLLYGALVKYENLIGRAYEDDIAQLETEDDINHAPAGERFRIHRHIKELQRLVRENAIQY